MIGYRKYAVILGLLFTVFVLVEHYRPKPINWKQTFSSKDKIPYGTYILYELLPGIFKNETVETVRLPIANQVDEFIANSSVSPGNYIFVNSTFNLDTEDLQGLLSYADRGNNVFISAHEFSDLLQDTLHFKTELAHNSQGDSVALLFTSPGIKKNRQTRYERDKIKMRLSIKPDQRVKVLGVSAAGDTNFVQIPWGGGNFYINTVPLAFTNYHVIAPRQADYAAIALSHLPVRPVLWDEYQKQGRVDDGSVFRVLMSHEPLTWAYYVSLCGLVVFIFFESKRTQRVIPVQEKPRNTTLEFVQVVGNLYFNYKNHKIIAEKKINYFLEYLRLHYHESTSELDAEFQETIAAKSGIALVHILALFSLIEQINYSETITEKQLWDLNKKLETFYQQASQ